MAALIAPWVYEPLAAAPYAAPCYASARGSAPHWCYPAARPGIQTASSLSSAGICSDSGATYTPRRSLVSSSSGFLVPPADDGVRSVSVPPILRTPWDAYGNDARRSPSAQQRQRPVALPLAAVRIGKTIPSTVSTSVHSAEKLGPLLPEGPAITPLEVSPSTRVFQSHARLNAAGPVHCVEHLGTKAQPLSASQWHEAEPITRSVLEVNQDIRTMPDFRNSPAGARGPAMEPAISFASQQQQSAGRCATQDSSPKNSVWKRYFAGEEGTGQFVGPLGNSRILTADSEVGANESGGLGGSMGSDVCGSGLRAMPVRRPSMGLRRYQAEPQEPTLPIGLPTTAPNSARDDSEGIGANGMPEAYKVCISVPGLECDLQAESRHRPEALHLHQVVSKFGPPVDKQSSIMAMNGQMNLQEAQLAARPCHDDIEGEDKGVASSIPPAQSAVVLNSAQVEAIAVAAAAVEHASRSISLKMLHELRSFRQPPTAVCQVVDALSTLLGCYESTWSAVKRRLDSALLHRLTSFSAMEAARCPSSRAQDFLELLEAPAFRDGSLADKCPAVAPLADWCLAVAHLLVQLRAADSEMQTESKFRTAPDTAKAHRDDAVALSNRGGLYVNPPLWELDEAALCCVEDLVVGRDGVGHITFHGQTDCRNLLNMLPDILMVEQGEIVVYPDATLKPEVGCGLNKPATVVLYGCMPKSQTCLTDTRARHRYKQRVAQMTEEKGAIFEDYDPDDGTWKFRVLHF